MKQFQRPQFSNQISLLSNISVTPTTLTKNENDDEKNIKPSQ